MVGERSDKVIVAVKAEKVISNAALAWALTHVVQPGDCVILLAVISPLKNGNRFWKFPSFTGDSGSRRKEDLPDRICQISESCSQMVLQFHNQIQVNNSSVTTNNCPKNSDKCIADNPTLLDLTLGLSCPLNLSPKIKQ